MSAGHLYGAYVFAQDVLDFMVGDGTRFKQRHVTDTGMSCPIWAFDCTTPLHAVIGSLMTPAPSGEVLVLWQDPQAVRIDRDRLMQTASVPSVSLDMVKADAAIPDYACAYLIDVHNPPVLGTNTDADCVAAVFDLHQLDAVVDDVWSKTLLINQRRCLIADEDDWGMARLYRGAYEMLLHRAQLAYSPKRAHVDLSSVEKAFVRRRAFELTLLPALVQLLTQEQYSSCTRASCFETYLLLRHVLVEFAAYCDAWQAWSAELCEQQGARLCADRLQSALLYNAPGLRG